MRTIRASEIGSFIFCRRAWWYRRRGIEPINQAELAAGNLFHQEQVHTARSALILQIIAWILIFAAVISMAAIAAGLLIR